MQYVKSFAVAALVTLCGCSTITPREREIAGGVALVVLAGSIEASCRDHGTRPESSRVKGIGPELRP